MPIKFRCPHCEQFLGISRGKAGALTDCPSCGRTIRIPELDGSVKPLPGAELNHKDADLAHALDALAQIGQGGSRQGGVAVKPAPAAAPAVVAPVREMQPLPLPEPIAIEAPLPAAPASTPAAKGHGPAQPAARTPARDPLEELAGLATAAQLSARYADRRPSIWTPGLITAAAAAGVILFGAGFLIGRATSSPTRPDGSANSTADTGTTGAAAPAAPTVTDAGLTPALTGRITYDSDDGGTKPDAGARIIALPEQRQGTATIAVAGFRAGADDADQQLARASLRALGGDFVIADEQGQYTIKLPAAGAYQLLVLSRHQPRDDAEPLDAAVQRALAAYFDRPTGLVGAVQYHYSTFRFQGQSPAPRDHTFARP
jgi:hypothetical protein